MLMLRTVLCPVDFSAATARQTALAAELCQAVGARLVLHHNLAAAPTGSSVGWMWAADHVPAPERVVEDELDRLLASVPPVVRAEARVTRGQPSLAVAAVCQAVEADLVILTTHGTEDDHESLTEQLLERGDCAVLALHEPVVDHQTPHFASAVNAKQVVLVPTDLSRESRAAVELAFELARKLPIELHLVHLMAHPRHDEHGGEGSAIAHARARMCALVPDDLVQRTQLHVEAGSPARGIADIAERLRASCIVMGEHTRGKLGSWLTRNTSRAVLHQAPCPVWYVPGRRAA
jgi:nucleotide-binding universal stress UspA family protein